MKSALLSVACLCGLAVMPAALATDAPAGDEAVSADSLRVVRDAQSGRLRAPTADELRAMVASDRAAPTSQALTVSVAPNGTKTVKLTPEYFVQLHAEVDANGQTRPSHTEPGLEQHAPIAVEE